MQRNIEECPSLDFTPGIPKGQCWGDGHYQCPDCIHYRADFKKHGQDYIDMAHTIQTGLVMVDLDGNRTNLLH